MLYSLAAFAVPIWMFRRRSLKVQETNMFNKTRRECISVGSVAASLLLTVLANMSSPASSFPIWRWV